MSILFIVPPNKLNQGFEQCRPLGIFYLLGVLREQGVKANLLDLERTPLADEEIVKVIDKEGYRILGLTATSHTRFNAIYLAHLLKSNFPNNLIIVGGPHFSQCAQDTLHHIKDIDIVVRGEAEGIVEELIPKLLGGVDWYDVKGISFRKEGNIQHNPDADPPLILDQLPVFADYKYDDYPDKLLVYTEGGKRIPAISILTSRGCPNQCIFCCVKNSRYRVRSAKLVVDEIEMWIKKTPGIHAFNFFDLTFTANPEHAKSVCKEIIARHLDIMWWAESRLNIELDLLDWMKRAGCSALSVGIESGSPRILKTIKKNIDLDSVQKFAKKCDDLKIQVSFFFMLSHPTETMEDLEKTRRIAHFLLASFKCVSDTSAGVTTILPGTELEGIARNKGVIPADFSWSMPFCEPENLRVSYSEFLPLYIENIPLEVLVKFREEIGALGNLKRRRNVLRLLVWGIQRLFSTDRSFQYKARVAFYTIKMWFKQYTSMN